MYPTKVTLVQKAEEISKHSPYTDIANTFSLLGLLSIIDRTNHVCFPGIISHFPSYCSTYIRANLMFMEVLWSMNTHTLIRWPTNNGWNPRSVARAIRHQWSVHSQMEPSDGTRRAFFQCSKRLVSIDNNQMLRLMNVLKRNKQMYGYLGSPGSSNRIYLL